MVLDGSEKPVEFGANKISLALFPPRARQLILEERLPLGRILADCAIGHNTVAKAFFTVTPSSPHCRAAALARLRVPSAALASGARRAAPVIAIVGTTTTIRPPRWRSTAWLAWRQASIVSSGASHCARHCASEISTSGDVR